jgi:hypothetical protein
VATRSREHPTKIECVDCAKLPQFDDVIVTALNGPQEFRPKVPRKIDPRSTETHKRSPRCTTHWLAWRTAQRVKGAHARSRKRSGLNEQTRQEVLALQGGVCPACGRGSGRRAVLSADHCHIIARAECDHPEDVACENCMRGFLCHRENRDILGLLFAQKDATTEQVIDILRNLANYLEDPPMQRYLRAREEEVSA